MWWGKARLAELMRHAGYRLQLSPDQWRHEAATASAKYLISNNINDLVAAAKASFAVHQSELPAGLDTLPACWLAQ